MARWPSSSPTTWPTCSRARPSATHRSWWRRSRTAPASISSGRSRAAPAPCCCRGAARPGSGVAAGGGAPRLEHVHRADHPLGAGRAPGRGAARPLLAPPRHLRRRAHVPRRPEAGAGTARPLPRAVFRPRRGDREHHRAAAGPAQPGRRRSGLPARLRRRAAHGDGRGHPRRGRRSACRRAKRARSASAAPPSSPATSRTRKRTPRPSPAAGSTPATSATSMRAASSTSPAGRATCSSPAAATSIRARWRRRC